MSDSAFAGATKGLLWAVSGAAIALVAVYTIGLPQPRQAAQPSAPLAAAVPAEDKSEALRNRLAALEREVAAQAERAAAQRAEMERATAAQRAEAERARPIERPAPAPKVSPAPKPAPPAPAARAKPASQPPVVFAPVAQPELVRVAPEPPRAPEPPPTAPQVKPAAPVETVASAERFAARGRYAEAAAILKPLAERDDARAQFRLGEMYLEGNGVERNEQEGVRLVRKAAGLGDSEAQVRMGEMYFRGRGVPQNNFQAYVWYNAAFRSGNNAAAGPQERIAALLQPVEVEQAAKVAATLVRQNQQKGR